MNCKKIRELILTDYLDDQAGEGQRAIIEAHLGSCPGCREVLAAARKVNSELSRNAAPLEPPRIIWERIRETILARKNRRTAFVAGFLERLRSFAYIPRPAFAIATIIILILAVGTTVTVKVHNRGAAASGAQDETGYSYYSAGQQTDLLVDEENGFGTQIEEYFL